MNPNLYFKRILMYKLNLLRYILTSVLTIFLSISFIFFSFQHYIPPSFQNSVSYSILNCPSHSNQNLLLYIILHISNSEGEEGNEKLCLCFPCCNQRLPFVIFKPLTNLSLDEYIICLFSLDENPYLKEFYTNLSIRSPPSLIV